MPAPDALLHALTFDAIGTSWQIDTPGELGEAERGAVDDVVAHFDQAYSRFRPDSLVTELARSGGSLAFPDDLGDLLEVYARLGAATGGAVTPLVGRSLEQLGYDAAYTLVPHGPAFGAPRWDEVVTVNGSTVTVSEPVLLDFGAAGKGYLVDLIADELRRLGVSELTIDASGDLLHRAGRPLRVALEHPYDPSRAVGVIELEAGVERAVCGSASNRRAWGSGLHHVLDGRTGEPVREVAATWAVADSALLADGLATALFFTDAASLAASTGWRFEAVRMMTDGRVETTADLPGEVFTR